jgi:NAD(P)-dependent dehydrogenase (short-subunit alcohol dehydrogenase family)
MSGFDNLFDPEHDAAIVTGAGNGIGRAIALGLVAQGVRTVFADVNEKTLEAAIKSASDPRLALAWAGDLAQKPECDRLLSEARKRLGLVTLFVHSASPPRHESDHLLAVTDETWERMRSVNLDAGFRLGREVAKDLIAATYFNDAVDTLRSSADPKALPLRAQALAGAGRYADAEAAYHEALKVNPDDKAGQLGLARVVAQQGRADEALALYEKVDGDESRLVDNPREALKGLAYLTEVSDSEGRFFSTSHQAYALRKLHTGLNGLQWRTRSPARRTSCATT